jgi:hypothetical protein
LGQITVTPFAAKPNEARVGAAVVGEGVVVVLGAAVDGAAVVLGAAVDGAAVEGAAVEGGGVVVVKGTVVDGGAAVAGATEVGAGGTALGSSTLSAFVPPHAAKTSDIVIAKPTTPRFIIST